MSSSSKPQTNFLPTSSLVSNPGNTPASTRNRVAIQFMLAMLLIAIPAFVDAAPFQKGFRVIGQLAEQTDVAEEEQVTVADVIDVLTQRIDPTGERGFVVRELQNGQVEITFPEASREEVVQIWARLTWTGNLVFRIVADKNQHPGLVKAAIETSAQRHTMVEGEWDGTETQPVGQWVRLAREQPPQVDPREPAPHKIIPGKTHLLRNGETGEIISFDPSQIQGQDLDERRKKFSEWCSRNGHNEIEVLVSLPATEKQNVEGGFLEHVEKGLDGSGSSRIEFSLNTEGGKRMRSLTSRNRPDDGRYKALGIVLDNQLLCAPRINEPIYCNAVIEGNFTEAEVDNLAIVLSSGALEIPLQETWISIAEIESETDK